MMETKVIQSAPESGSFRDGLHVHQIREVRENGIMHFGHEHPLTFREYVKNGFEDVICCHGCGNEIGSCGFSCTMENCSFVLHEFCACLAKVMEDYPQHPQHPLTLYKHLPSDPSSHFVCKVCAMPCALFYYRCESCDFNVGLRCASMSVLVCSNDTHEHAFMTAQLYPASFLCCFCGEDHSKLGMSYHCRTCSFWIQEQCYSLPKIIKHGSHVHQLQLLHRDDRYVNPPKLLRRGDQDLNAFCGVCQENIKPAFWFYVCQGCRYQVHIKCSIKKWIPPKIEIPVEQFKKTNLLFPLSSTKLVQDTLAQFIQNICQWKDAEGKNGDILRHPGHDHPITPVFDSRKFVRRIDSDDNSKRGEYDLCNACMLPLLDAPLYSCNQSCNFVLHKWCVNLPRKLKHPAHTSTGHTLVLYERLGGCFGFFRCMGCREIGNGFAYKCNKCEEYYLDIRCAALPSSVYYKTPYHDLRHPLLLKHRGNSAGCISCGNSNIHRCESPSCNYSFGTISPCSSPFLFGCDVCHVYIDIKCLMLPREVQHWYDEHGFKLTPSTDVPSHGDNENLHYHCEFCVKKIASNKWIYYCSECDQCAHVECVRWVFGLFPSLIKFGGGYKSPHHEHPLTCYMILEKPVNPCYRCHKQCFRFGIGFRCNECENVVFGLECASSNV